MGLSLDIVDLLCNSLSKKASVHEELDGLVGEKENLDKKDFLGHKNLLRYGLLGAAVNPTVDIIGHAIKGIPVGPKPLSTLEKLKFYTGATNATPLGIARGIGSSAAKGFLGGAVIPVVKSGLDRFLEPKEVEVPADKGVLPVIKVGSQKSPYRVGVPPQGGGVPKPPGPKSPGPGAPVHKQVPTIPGMSRILPGAAKTTIGKGTFKKPGEFLD